MNSVQKKTPLELIVLERRRQLHELGYDAEHDDRLYNGNLVISPLFRAAAAYLYSEVNMWPWAKELFPRDIHTNRAKYLIQSGALFNAEMDRLGRLIESKIGSPKVLKSRLLIVTQYFQRAVRSLNVEINRADDNGAEQEPADV